MENVSAIKLIDEQGKEIGSYTLIGASSVTHHKQNTHLTLRVKNSGNNIKNITGDNIMEISTKK